MLRMIILWLVVLPLVHWVVARYYRSLRREALERDFDDGGEAGTREAFIAEGMAAYQKSLGRKILVLVFIILFIQRRPRGLFALKGRSVE